MRDAITVVETHIKNRFKECTSWIDDRGDRRVAHPNSAVETHSSSTFEALFHMAILLERAQAVAETEERLKQ